MTVLLSTVFGSKLYGTDNPSSDTDYIEVYVPNMVDVLSGKKITNTVTQTNGKSKNNQHDVDVTRVPYTTFIRDVYDGQSYAIEVLFAALQRTDLDPVAHEFFKGLKDEILNDSICAMIGYATQQATKYGIKGRRYGVLKSISDELLTLSESELNTLKLGDWVDTLLKLGISEIESGQYVTNKMSGTTKSGITLYSKTFYHDIPMYEFKSRISAMLSQYGSRSIDASQSGDIDWRGIAHAIRVTGQVIRLLSTGELHWPIEFAEANFIRDVKRGLVNFDMIENEFVERMKLIEQYRANTVMKRKDLVTPEMIDLFIRKHTCLLYGIEDA